MQYIRKKEKVGKNKRSHFFQEMKVSKKQHQSLAEYFGPIPGKISIS
jgi:hypothetical protein